MYITKITIGRLYNLGSYEHVRYELTAEIPAGQSPATAIIGMENILGALNPKRPHGVPSESDIRNLESSLAATREATDEQVRRSYGKSKYGRILSLHHSIAEGKSALARWNERQVKARLLLEDLGGAANYKDAKEDWDDDSQF